MLLGAPLSAPDAANAILPAASEAVLPAVAGTAAACRATLDCCCCWLASVLKARAAAAAALPTWEERAPAAAAAAAEPPCCAATAVAPPRLLLLRLARPVLPPPRPDMAWAEGVLDEMGVDRKGLFMLPKARLLLMLLLPGACAPCRGWCMAEPKNAPPMGVGPTALA